MKETKEIGFAILDLLTSQSLGILTIEESTLLSHLRARKESLLAHQILTWKLKSRVDWIQEGDANTKFFHSFSLARRNAKSIWDLKDRNGDLIEDDTKLKALGVQHFSDLFSNDGKTNIEAQLNVIRLFPSFVQEEDKELFFSDFTLPEVECVLKGFKKDKSPGLNGWPVEFYLHFFDLVFLDILKVIEHSRV